MIKTSLDYCPECREERDFEHIVINGVEWWKCPICKVKACYEVIWNSDDCED